MSVNELRTPHAGRAAGLDLAPRPLEWFEAEGRVRDGGIPYGAGVLPALRRELEPRGVLFRDVRLDRTAYESYVRRAGYESRPSPYGLQQVEKQIEHYAAATLLELTGGDTYIDVASSMSLAPEIYEALYGCRVYVQDLTYPGGVQGNRIGGDAAGMPVEAGFASKMGLHCSFEHFEGSSDSRFIREVGRVLRPGGRCCILPLYVAEEYAIQTDPDVARREGVLFESDARVYRVTGWGQRHGRFYSPERLRERLLNAAEGLTCTLVHFTNPKDLDSSCYLTFALLLEKSA